MKKLLLIALALFGTMSVQAHIQDSTKKEKPTAEQKAEKLTKRMKKQLELSDSQVIQVKAINLEHIKALETLKASDTKGEARKTQKEALKTSYLGKLEKVLTADQMTKFKANMEKAKEKHKKHKGKGKHKRGDNSGDVDESED
ncbi:MAG: hypothetical protein EP332_10075 [Bacteroidetes bacterium]|nr:MAG: hypothetical protein EP332_10075 [Bacteroidota bacterium]